jgi:hypothetical protein
VGNRLLQIRDGVLYVWKLMPDDDDENAIGWKVLLPKALIKLALKMYHDDPMSGGHFANAKTYSRSTGTTWQLT